MSDSNYTINTGLGTLTYDTYNYFNTLISNPSVMLILLVAFILYIVLFISLGTNSVDNATSSSSYSSLFVFIIAFVLFIVFYKYFFGFGVNIITKISNLFSKQPEIDIGVDTTRIQATKAPVPELLLRKQVFNIPGNDYVYQDAKALCSAYGARLATYKEVEDAYNSGGEWCNYGWSDGQMALFPTQQKTFDELQKKEGHENDCGRPGVNGGYIDNPHAKFGVNCYGFKPRMTSTEENLMANEPLYPKTMKDIAMENRVNYWKDKLSEILVSPFNHNSWSRI